MVPNRFYGWTISNLTMANLRSLCHVDVDYHRYGQWCQHGCFGRFNMIWSTRESLFIIYTLYSMAMFPTREHLEMHAFLSFTLRHVDDFWGFKFRPEIPKRIQEAHQDEIQSPNSVNVDGVQHRSQKFSRSPVSGGVGGSLDHWSTHRHFGVKERMGGWVKNAGNFCWNKVS